MSFIATLTSGRATKRLEGHELPHVEFSDERGLVCRVNVKMTKDRTPYLAIWDATGMTTKTIHHPLRIARQWKEQTAGECAICDAPLGLDKKCPYGC